MFGGPFQRPFGRRFRVHQHVGVMFDGRFQSSCSAAFARRASTAPAGRSSTRRDGSGRLSRPNCIVFFAACVDQPSEPVRAAEQVLPTVGGLRRTANRDIQPLPSAFERWRTTIITVRDGVNSLNGRTGPPRRCRHRDVASAPSPRGSFVRPPGVPPLSTTGGVT